MALNVTDDARYRQQGTKKCNNNKKDAMALVKDKLTEFNTTMSTLTDRVEYMYKRIEGMESMDDMEELCEEMQATKSSVVIDINKEI